VAKAEEKKGENKVLTNFAANILCMLSRHAFLHPWNPTFASIDVWGAVREVAI